MIIKQDESKKTVFIVIKSDIYETAEVYAFERKTDAEEMKQKILSCSKLGADIYEGDIVRTINYGGKTERISEVVLDDIQPAFILKSTDWTESDWSKCGTSEHEVIGNIYENQGLLKGVSC